MRALKSRIWIRDLCLCLMVYHQQMYFLPMHTDALFRIQNSAQLGTIVRTRLMQGLIAFAVRGIAFFHF